MKIKMLTLCAGPDGVMAAGSVHEVADATARALIAGRFAEEVKSAPVVIPAEEKIEAEVQSIEEIETAVKPAPKSRKVVSRG